MTKSERKATGIINSKRNSRPVMVDDEFRWFRCSVDGTGVWIFNLMRTGWELDEKLMKTWRCWTWGKRGWTVRTAGKLQKRERADLSSPGSAGMIRARKGALSYVERWKWVSKWWGSQPQLYNGLYLARNKREARRVMTWVQEGQVLLRRFLSVENRLYAGVKRHWLPNLPWTRVDIFRKISDITYISSYSIIFYIISISLVLLLICNYNKNTFVLI